MNSSGYHLHSCECVSLDTYGESIDRAEVLGNDGSHSSTALRLKKAIISNKTRALNKSIMPESKYCTGLTNSARAIVKR